MAPQGLQFQIRSPERIGVIQHLRGVRIVSREHGRSAWRTLGGGAEGVLEYRRFGGEGILVWRIEKRINESQGLPVLLVRAEVKNIGTPNFGALAEGERRKGKRADGGAGGVDEFATR